MSGTVDVISRDGQRGTVDEDELSQAIQAGARVVTPEERHQEDVTSAGSKAMAAITSADESLGGIGTELGLAAHAAAYGDSATDEAASQIREMREANPGAAMGGALLGGLVMPGPSLELGAESALGRIAAASAEGGLQGTLAGAGHALTEDALGNPDANAEAFFVDQMATGLLGGSALGLGMGLGAEGTRAGLGKLGTALAGSKRAGAELVSGYGSAERAVDGLMGTGLVTSDEASRMVTEAQQSGRVAALGDRVTGGVSQKYFDIMAKGDPEMARILRTQYEQGASLASHTAERLDSLTRDVASAGDRLIKVEDALYDQSITAKASKIREMVDPTKTAEAIDSAVSMVRNIRDFIAPLEASEWKMGAAGFSNKLRALSNEAEKDIQRITAPLQSGNANAMDSRQMVADLFMTADNLKRNVGKAERMIGFGADGSVKAGFQDFYNSALKAPLEDGGAWGDAVAAAQRDVNNAWTQRLAIRQDFGRNFSTSFGKDGFDRLERMDPSKVLGYLNGIDGAGNYLKKEAVEGWLTTLQNAIDVTEQHYGEHAQFAEGRTAISELRKRLSSASEESSTLSKLNSQRLAEGDGIGGALGLVSDVFTRPLKTAERLASIRQAVDRTHQGIRRAVDGIFGEVTSSRASASALASMGLGRSEVKAAAKEVRSLSQNPSAFMERVGRSLEGLGRAAPKHAASITSVAARSVMHLASVAPTGRQDYSTIRTPGEPRFTDSELDSFGKRLQAARNPISVIHAAANGRVSREQIDTLKATSPQLFERIQMEALDKIHRMQRDGTIDRIPYAKRLAIGVLLDIPADVTMTPDFVSVLQQSMGPMAQGQSQNDASSMPIRRRVEIDNDVLQTDAQRIEDGGTQ